MVFKDIPGYEGYYKISSNGKVWSVRNQCYLKVHKNKSGYNWVWIQGSTRKERNHFYLHRLVAQSFISNPENKLEVNHKDGNKDNCDYTNLEWMTHKENIIHGHQTGLWKIIKKMEWWKWTENQLLAFESTPYNIPAIGYYEYPSDLNKRIQDIKAAYKLSEAALF